MDFPEKELELRERGLRIKERELELKVQEAGKSRWRSPLVVSILAAALAAGSNAWIAFYNAETNRRDERIAAENARILQMLKADTEQAASNLKFLIDTKLITDLGVRASLSAYLQGREPGQGPSLNSGGSAPSNDAEIGIFKLMNEIFRDEIKQFNASVDMLDANFIIVRISTWMTYENDSAELTESFRTEKLPKIAKALQSYIDLHRKLFRRDARVAVLAHTDSKPLASNSAWNSNYELSLRRAAKMQEGLEEHLPENLNLIVEGRGPDDPLCEPVDTPECWPINNRLELLLER